jgi:DNA-binding NarL/FixJ family response regulator
MQHNVALVDDHHLMRAGLVSTVNALGSYRVTMEAGNGREFIEMLGAVAPSAEHVPKIAVVDLNMPVMDGYATIAWLRSNAPGILPLALTFDATDDAMVRAVRAGARGFVLKSARPNVLKTALDSLLLTGYYYTEEANDLHERNPEWKTKMERDHDRVRATITPREMEFLQHVCSDDEPTYEQIASIMGIHRRTVDNYRIALFEKFNIKSKTGLVLFALRWGLLR